MQTIWRKVSRGWGRWKPFVSPLFLMAIFAFLGKTLYDHWHEMSSVQITALGWSCLVIATGVTLFAHVWTGWVWGWILQELGQPVSRIWAAQAYLKTNIAKYLPSNLLHLYGRAIAAKDQGVPLAIASLSVLLDTLLMAASGLILGLFSIPRDWLPFTVFGIVCILIGLHPKLLGRLIRRLSAKLNLHTTEDSSDGLRSRMVTRYPAGPLLGEVGFIVLRGIGFVLTVAALTPISLSVVPILISIYSIGWVLGFITPGAPGGLGIFELTVSALLTQQELFHNDPGFSVGIAISAVAIHRLISTLAEAIGAVLAWADERWPLPFGR
ncbi:MAG TPA: lysylphosphatidylglycerol synthase domain-containing protein [Stenomitos sp.]